MSQLVPYLNFGLDFSSDPSATMYSENFFNGKTGMEQPERNRALRNGEGTGKSIKLVNDFIRTTAFNGSKIRNRQKTPQLNGECTGESLKRNLLPCLSFKR